MALIRADHFIPKLIDTTPITSGSEIISQSELLNGASSVTFQFVLTNGGAATCYAEATNYETTDPGIVWVPCQSFALSANNVGTMVFSPVDQLTGMHAFRIRIDPSASGSVRVLCNLRHLSNG